MHNKLGHQGATWTVHIGMYLRANQRRTPRDGYKSGLKTETNTHNSSHRRNQGVPGAMPPQIFSVSSYVVLWGAVSQTKYCRQPKSKILAPTFWARHAQDQALHAKCHKTTILHTTNDPKCRMCNEKDETVAHMAGSCVKVAGNFYKTRHDNGATAAIHHSINTKAHAWLHKQNPVAESKVKNSKTSK